jgi:hypothetical protein
MILGEKEYLLKNMEKLEARHYTHYALLYNMLVPGDSVNIFAELVRGNMDHYDDPVKNWDYLVWSHNHKRNLQSKAMASYVLKDWDGAETRLIGLKQKDIDWESYSAGSLTPSMRKNIDWYMNAWLDGFLGCVYARQGKTNQAIRQAEILESYRLTYPSYVMRMHKGILNYLKARIYALLGEKKKAVELLEKSWNAGLIMDYGHYVYDWDLTSLHGYEPYEELVRSR